MKSTLALQSVLATVLLAVAHAHGTDWPRWRGPANDGHVTAGTPVPATLPATPPVLWRAEVGFGLASPVVSGERVFLLDAQAGKETAHAFDAATGKELWRTPIDQLFKDHQSDSGPRCTPLVDGDRVYVQSCRGELQCLDAKTGKQTWRVNYVTDFGAVFTGEKGSAAGASRHGYAGSPVLDGDRLYTCAGGANGAGVVCLDKRTGKTVWKSQRDVAGYAAPVIAELGGVRQVIAFTAESLMGLSTGDGALQWRVPVKTSLGRHVTTPVVWNDLVLVSSHQTGLLAVRVSRDADGLRATPAWTNRAQAINYASPVVVDDHLYGLGKAQRLTCVDLRTGKPRWTERSFSGAALKKDYTSLIVMGRRLLVLTDSGRLMLVAADPAAFRPIGPPLTVGGRTWCHPAYVDGRLYLRDEKELKCLVLLP